MNCIGPIPAHLRHYGWYASHQAWLRDRGKMHHDPGGAEPERVSLAGVDLSSAYLRSAKLSRANLCRAHLYHADLTYADLSCAHLSSAYLHRAVLTRAYLYRADLTDADLTDADLTGAGLYRAVLADLTGADLTGATLTGADLTSATLPDGRTLEQWRLDPLDGLCTDPDSVARAAAAWGGRSWRDCPLHEGMGVSELNEIEDADTRRLASIFVALLDGGHLPQPPETP